jgi:hypothetical protein
MIKNKENNVTYQQIPQRFTCRHLLAKAYSSYSLQKKHYYY